MREITITTPKRQLTAAEAIAEFRTARKAGDARRAQQQKKEEHVYTQPAMFPGWDAAAARDAQ
jgi:hypothetical protein|tara:strand:- start:588 stop:776 length:189 start_codon:yes stop_codon:yes gene_type:complete